MLGKPKRTFSSSPIRIIKHLIMKQPDGRLVHTHTPKPHDHKHTAPIALSHPSQPKHIQRLHNYYRTLNENSERESIAETRETDKMLTFLAHYNCPWHNDVSGAVSNVCRSLQKFATNNTWTNTHPIIAFVSRLKQRRTYPILLASIQFPQSSITIHRGARINTPWLSVSSLCRDCL